jgi:hypothetical protein
MHGAGSRIRTDDLLITNQLLYQLSYAGENALKRYKSYRVTTGTPKEFTLAIVACSEPCRPIILADASKQTVAQLSPNS